MAFPTNHPSLHQPHYQYIHPSIHPGLVCVKEIAMIALQRKCNVNFHSNNFSRFIFCMQKLLLVVKIYFSQIFPRFFPDFSQIFQWLKYIFPRFFPDFSQIFQSNGTRKKVVFHGVANSESALQSRLVLSHLRQVWEHRPLQYLQTFQT